jgi:hypothetical protein
VPAAQGVQAAALVWPSSAENVPAGQFEQAAELVWPSSVENVPAGQVVHSDQPSMFHPAMKPEYVSDLSDVKVILRKPVVDL